MNSIERFDNKLPEQPWEEIDLTGSRFGKRTRPIVSKLNDDEIIVLGGFINDRTSTCYDDAWTFDVRTNTITKQETTVPVCYAFGN